MSPAADLDERLLGLQGQVAEARVKHEELVERCLLLERTKHYASATVLRVHADRAFRELRVASHELARYISQRQRGLK